MTDISTLPLPKPINWDDISSLAELHIAGLDGVFLENQLNLLWYLEALAEVCSETHIARRKDIAAFWQPYLYREPGYTLQSFFAQWLTYTPTPDNPGQYIEYWDYLVNTESGLKLANDGYFRGWLRQFLNFHGDWINSTSSTGTLSAWMNYAGTEQHPFNINHYERPDPHNPQGGFDSFNQFFLRNLKPGQRPLCPRAGEQGVIVSPCDGGVFFLDKGGYDVNESHANNHYVLPGKSGDRFNLIDAIPGYGRCFIGGPLLDILLWFTDYHHFHAPVSGTVIDQGLYEGAYNYDFDNFNPRHPYDPLPPKNSDKASWYQKLGKHQRYVWVIKTPDLGLVAMIAIGFWGVGSIVNAIENGAEVERGQYMGHFGYGGSSIVLAFEPGREYQFKVGEQPVSGPNNPTQMQVRGCLGRVVPPLEW